MFSYSEHSLKFYCLGFKRTFAFFFFFSYLQEIISLEDIQNQLFSFGVFSLVFVCKVFWFLDVIKFKLEAHIFPLETN